MEIVLEYFFAEHILRTIGPIKCIGDGAEVRLVFFQLFHFLCKIRRWAWTILAGAIQDNGFVTTCRWIHRVFASPVCRALRDLPIPCCLIYIIFGLSDLYFSDLFSQFKTCAGIAWVSYTCSHT